MLRTASPNISVITDFGCDNNCWYCIWKKHSLYKQSQPTDWEQLREFLTLYKEKGKVSLSGGGDPLYKFQRWGDSCWISAFFYLAESLQLKVDIHTREKVKSAELWNRTNLCAFSSDNLTNDILHLLYLKDLVKTRIVHVVTKNTTNAMVGEYLEFAEKYGLQITFKQLWGFSDEGRYEELQKLFPHTFYLPTGDYNIYFMPDNKIYNQFIF